MNGNRPVGITADRTTRELKVSWNDGHESLYPFGLLRAACPCAECRGGHANMSSEPDPAFFVESWEVSPANQLRNLEAVGSYAITFEWEDGHHYGIYQWNYLRKLCPCPVCRSEAR